jgi:hypothetical protein
LLRGSAAERKNGDGVAPSPNLLQVERRHDTALASLRGRPAAPDRM